MNKEKIEIIKLKEFFYKASFNTYASDNVETINTEDGYKILRFSDGDWSYEDKYTGFFRSWGSETISYKDKIVWRSNYGGGIVDDYIGDVEFAKETFGFLKLVMRNKPIDNEKFFLRGPSNFEDGNYKYEMNIDGDISSFSGSENIKLNNKIVFDHNFMGGLVISKG